MNQMDTVLNLGINDEVAAALAAKVNNDHSCQDRYSYALKSHWLTPMSSVSCHDRVRTPAGHTTPTAASFRCLPLW